MDFFEVPVGRELLPWFLVLNPPLLLASCFLPRKPKNARQNPRGETYLLFIIYI
jgi:hypothetical protein